MSRAEFDRFASNYRTVHRQNIAVTGEEPEYFAAYKMRDFARITERFGVPSDGTYLDFGSGVGASVQPFRERLPQARLICADVSPDSLAESKNTNGDGAVYMRQAAREDGPR